MPAQQGLLRAWEPSQLHALTKTSLLAKAGRKMQWCWWKWALLLQPVPLGGGTALLASRLGGGRGSAAAS